jgi:hypothetical protein
MPELIRFMDASLPVFPLPLPVPADEAESEMDLEPTYPTLLYRPFKSIFDIFLFKRMFSLLVKS